MKREGYQHGMVKTHAILSASLNPQPKPRSLGGFSSAPTAGSKFTGKCGRPMCRECHISPASKSKDKAKGAQRLRLSSDIVSDYKLITWRVVDARPGVRLSGFSATSILHYLDRHDECMDSFED